MASPRASVICILCGIKRESEFETKKDEKASSEGHVKITMLSTKC